MPPSSRTPEGEPGFCPVCGNAVCVEPSRPPGDATCPCCGHLLWFDARSPEARPPRLGDTDALVSTGTHECDIPPPAPRTRGFDRSDRRTWLTVPLLSALMVGVFDASALRGAICLVLALAYGQIALPALFGSCQRFYERYRSIYVGALFGWALIPGPMVGILFGIVVAWAHEWPGGALGGALLGMVVGPVVAALEGLLIVACIAAGFRIVTGRSFAEL